jgi:hypothetical protein
METSSSIAPSTANPAPTPTTSETDTHREVRLTFGGIHENPNLNLLNNF